MSQHLPHPELPDPELDDRDRATSSSLSKHAATSDPDRTDTDPPPGWDALRAIARLLGREAARDHMAQGG